MACACEGQTWDLDNCEDGVIRLAFGVLVVSYARHSASSQPAIPPCPWVRPCQHQHVALVIGNARGREGAGR